jgi:hypothetical protein
MFWMRAYLLRGEVEGAWALEFSSLLGPVKWHRAHRHSIYNFKYYSRSIACMEQISEVEEKLFTSSLNIYPEAM